MLSIINRLEAAPHHLVQTADQPQKSYSLRYYIQIKEGTQTLGTFVDPSRIPRPGRYEQTLTFFQEGDQWVVEDSLKEHPAIVRNGLDTFGVERWLVKLLDGKTCNRLECISGVFYESAADNITYSLS